jgi:methanogen homoaconitase large subunit
MGQTLAEQILSHAAGRAVKAGDLVVVQPDIVMSHDSLTPSIIKIMQEQLGVPNIKNPGQLVFSMDHVVPASTVGVANSQNIIRKFAKEQGVRLFEVGRGICHQVLVEEGVARPGRIVLGSDSHSTSYGSVGAFGSGMGSTDVAMIWATGKTWLRVPETIRFQIRGRFRPFVTPKDLALRMCSIMGIDGANYMAVEYHGIEWMDLEGRQTISSMAVEMGAKVGMVPPSGSVAQRFEVPDWLFVDPGATYARTVEIDLDELEPQVSIPHAVDDVAGISQVAGTPVSVVFLGTCTNGRYEDMHAAASLLRGKHVAEGVRMIITPASSTEMARAMADGSLAALMEAGAVLSTPGCGMCMGRHMGTLGDEDVCLSTGNRNFKGRMGSPNSKVYLASPLVAAATAIAGRISDPRDL